MRAGFEHEHHERFFHTELIAQATPACGFEAEAAAMFEITDHDHRARFAWMVRDEYVLPQSLFCCKTLVAGHFRHRASTIGWHVGRRIKRYPPEGDMPDNFALYFGNQRHFDLAGCTQPLYQVCFTIGGEGACV
jgi:hypothetical protein